MKMKKTLIPILLLITMGCKKNYHCECDVVFNSGYATNTKTGSFKEKPRKAQSVCDANEEEFIRFQGTSCKCVVVAE